MVECFCKRSFEFSGWGHGSRRKKNAGKMEIITGILMTRNNNALSCELEVDEASLK